MMKKDIMILYIYYWIYVYVYTYTYIYVYIYAYIHTYIRYDYIDLVYEIEKKRNKKKKENNSLSSDSFLKEIKKREKKKRKEMQHIFPYTSIFCSRVNTFWEACALTNKIPMRIVSIGIFLRAESTLHFICIRTRQLVQVSRISLCLKDTVNNVRVFFPFTSIHFNRNEAQASGVLLSCRCCKPPKHAFVFSLFVKKKEKKKKKYHITIGKKSKA